MIVEEKLLVMKASSAGSSIDVVTDVRAVRLLIDTAQVKFVAPFLGRERSAGEASSELGVSIDQVLARLRRRRSAETDGRCLFRCLLARRRAPRLQLGGPLDSRRPAR